MRLPIQKGLLELLLFEIERFFKENNQPYLKIMYKALFSLAYYGMMRVGELTMSDHTLKACNIHIGGNKDKLMMTLYTSKTHGRESRLQKIKISAIQQQKGSRKTIFCPFKMIRDFMNLRGHYADESEQFFIYRDRSLVRPDHFRNMLRKLLNKLGLDASLYDIHSFRSGRTSDLVKFGYSMEQIKAMGRWRSNAVYRYLKD